ncbi:hypothetical protein HYT18_01290 [Candidatus Microgenomates bacterium]|nr:hypothetical protein [Candidatus Microgenomates bacterium]
MAQVERINMADASSAETGSTTTLAPPNAVGMGEQVPPASGVATESAPPITPIPPPFEHIFEGAPESALDPSIIPENIPPSAPQQTSEQPLADTSSEQAEIPPVVERPPGFGELPPFEPGEPRRGGGPPPPDGGNGGDREPPPRGPEWETSPERGRWLVEEIVRFRTTMTYEERYNEVNGPVYAQRLQELKEYVDALCGERNDPDPFGPHKAYPRPAQREPGQPLQPPEFPPLPQAIQEMNEMVEQFRAQYQLEGTEEAEGFPAESLPDSNDPNRSIETRRNQYANTTSQQELQDAQKDLQVYFRQAKNQGLLKEVDAVLNTVYQQIINPRIPPEEADVLFERGIARARVIALVEFRERSLEDPNLPQQLAGVGEAYIDWASRRLERSRNGQPQPDHIEGEWSVPTPEQVSRAQRETYWETTSYPKYYHVTARTPEQFLIAKETFFQMIRSGSVGKSPAAIFEHVKNFIESFGAEGGRQVREGNIDADFLEENRLELEALLYVFVGNYANEVYNPKQKKEAMVAMSLDEGPARWVALYRAGKGGVAVFTEIFDFEDVMDIYNNPVGERGELDIVAGHFKQDQIQEMVIERGMGIVLKDYDPRDEYFNSDDLQAKIDAAGDLERIKSDLRSIENDISTGRIKLKPGETAIDLLGGDNQAKRVHDQARLNAYRANLKRLGLTKSDEEFKRLYEGFDKGDYHIKNYLSYKEDQDRFAEDQSKPEDQRQYQRKYPAFADLPETIRKSIDLGRIQVQLRELRQAIIRGQIKLEKGEKAIDRLSPRDRQAYKAAYDEAAANFDIAFQMQGVLGEKARRGRGFLYVDRNPHIQYYQSVSDGLRLKWIDTDKTKVINTDALKVEEIEKIRDSLPQANRRSFEIGWMLYKMRGGESGGKRLDSFPKYWQDLYARLSPEDKHDFVDNIPTYQAENFVQWGVTWTKMKYANEPAKVRRQKVREARARLTEELRTKGYTAQLLDDELGPDGQPKPMTFKRPLGRIEPNTGQFTKFKNGEILGFNQAGKEVKLSFDNNGNPIGLEFDQDGKVIIYDKADPNDRQLVNYDNINKNTKAKLVGDTLVEEAVATFQIAAQSSDFRNRYTDHTYWYYQGNNRVTILAPRIFKVAERIRDGLSRWEDEDILATQLLIVDPTLRRVKKFEDVQQQREVALVAAAVLESFQDRQRGKHGLYRAFLPRDGYIGRMRVGYRNEDWAGMDRFTLGFVEFAAQQTSRLSRRLGAEIADAPFEHDAAGPRWGVHGLSGAVKVMADEIKKISHQGIVGQFGLTKIFEVQDKAVEMFNHSVGYVDPQTGEWVFGLYEKPTDNNETMHGYAGDAISGDLLDSATKTIPFLYKFKECFGRLTKVTHDMRVMYSATDNSAGALNLEEVEVFLSDGSFNTAIESDKDILKNNGTARNRQDAFLYGEEGRRGFYDWLQDESPGGGADVYRREKYWNSFLSKKFKIYEGGNKTTGSESIEDWLTDKII